MEKMRPKRGLVQQGKRREEEEGEVRAVSAALRQDKLTSERRDSNTGRKTTHAGE
jgi:hypothetical protein